MITTFKTTSYLFEHEVCQTIKAQTIFPKNQICCRNSTLYTIGCQVHMDYKRENAHKMMLNYFKSSKQAKSYRV